jgi:hypothetical protein
LLLLLFVRRRQGGGEKEPATTANGNAFWACFLFFASFIGAAAREKAREGRA